jgi:hypothetical protein
MTNSDNKCPEVRLNIAQLEAGREWGESNFDNGLSFMDNVANDLGSFAGVGIDGGGNLHFSRDGAIGVEGEELR